ncbi:peptide chain release factor 2 [Desulfocurvibacter africanus]|nr:peptide chain release factor 2 [Desulfocurvibacter africanus]
MLHYNDLKARGAQLLDSYESLWGRLDHDRDNERLRQIEDALSKPGAWDKPDRLTPMLQEKRQISEKLERLTVLHKTRQEVEEWLDLAREEQAQEVLAILSEQLDVLQERLKDVELREMLAGPEDQNSAIMEIHSGAGGTEAQDWAEMLLRMYRRWSERQGYKVSILDFLEGEEAGFKSVTVQVEGLYAYGMLKGESGIHRLIRISPFDTSGRRHTSFASVAVYPDVGTDIDIDVREEDLRIDVFRASGAGGQHVNKTESAVRITHLPTGVVAQCQNEKSQLRNKETALKILKARLYELELKKIAAARQAEYESKDTIAWGSQIRTYTLQPYRLVKDHRTGMEIGDVEAVLNGEIDPLIRNFLLEFHVR